MSDRIPTQRLMIHLHPVVQSTIGGNVSKADDRDSVCIRADLIAVVGWDEEKQNSQIILDLQAGVQRLTVTERPELIFKAIEEAVREEWAGRPRSIRDQMLYRASKLEEKGTEQEEKAEDDTPS